MLGLGLVELAPRSDPLCDAWHFEGGREFAVEFLDLVQRCHGGDVVLAAESRRLWVDWGSVRGRFLNRLPGPQPAHGGKGPGKRPPAPHWDDQRPTAHRRRT